MSKNLDFAIGKKLPLDILMQPVFLGGGRGSGKTSGAKTLYEAAYDAGAQCIAIAPTGKWFSLRLAADGKSPGLADVVVFGGPHGDVPLLATSGKLIARLLVEKRVHAVLDVSLFRKGERARFLADFLEEFWLLKKIENDSFPVVVFVEEAHAVVPQKPQPEEARMLGAAEDLVREGRNHGIGVVLLDQRSAVVNKNVLALVEVLLAMRTIHHLDRKTFEAWVVEKDGELGEWVKELPAMTAGEAYLYAPVLGIFERIKMRMPRTFNATATARIGERTVAMGKLSPIDVTALKESMAEVVAEAERDDPKALRREIAALKAELAKKPTAKAPPAPKPKPVPVIAGKERAAVDRLASRLERVIDDAANLRDDVKTLLAKYPAEPTVGERITARSPLPEPKWSQMPKAMAKYTDLRPPTESAGGPSKYALHLLQTAASRLPLRPTRSQLAVLSGRSTKSSAFDLAISEILKNGWMKQEGDALHLMQRGIELVGGVLPDPQSPEEVQQTWLRALPAYPAAMLRAIIHQPGLTRAELSEKTGRSQTSSAFDLAISTLKKQHLVVDEGGVLRPAEMLLGAA